MYALCFDMCCHFRPATRLVWLGSHDDAFFAIDFYVGKYNVFSASESLQIIGINAVAEVNLGIVVDKAPYKRVEAPPRLVFRSRGRFHREGPASLELNPIARNGFGGMRRE